MPFDILFLGTLAALAGLGLALDGSGKERPEGKDKGRGRAAVKGNRRGARARKGAR